MGEVGKALTRKIGPAPAWVWLSLFLVAMLIFRFLKKPARGGGQGFVAYDSTGPSVVAQPYPVFPPTPTPTPPPAGITRPTPPQPPSGLSAKFLNQWANLQTWWMAGGQGTPPMPAPPHVHQTHGRPPHKQFFTADQYAAFQSALAFYQANPYPTSTTPAVTATASVTDPTASNA